MIDKKAVANRLTPSQLIKKQLTGAGFYDETAQKPRIVEFLNLADFSINTESYVSIDEPLFEAVPPIITFSDYEPLQIKEKVFRLRNKDRFSRRVKIIQPDSKLFQIMLPHDAGTKTKIESGTKVAAGMETKFIVRFSPEAKIDYKYELIVVTERQKFIVPIVAVGKRAMIDFPDVLDFGQCPVKFNSEKPVIIRNLGEKTTKWSLDLPTGFSANIKEGVLEPGKNEQMLIKFYPTEAKMYKAIARLEYDKLTAMIDMIGVGQLANVYLSKSVIAMQESYIGLQSQQTLHIVNKSNVKVSFEWRAFVSEREEKPKKQLLCLQLQEQQAEQLMLLREIISSNEKVDEQGQHNIDDSSSQEQIDQRQYLERRRKRAELALARKYKTIKKAIEDDLFLFQDSIFKIEPLIGEIWPNSEIIITVTFMPKQANTYDCMAYCNISCAEQRLALKLKGQGLGPKAYLTQQQINFGDIFVNQPIKQTVQIENRGQIPCRFTLEKPTRAFAKMFEFSIEERTLEVGENCSIEIRFKSSIPGEFKEKFKWQLTGSQRSLEMTFLGHVIAPTFEFVDPNDTNKAKPQINFGKVSYDFDYKEGIILRNTSSVEFTYNLKILSDSKILQSEFRITPQSGTIPEKSERLIEIEFTPKSIKKYETVMTIDIDGVGNDMLSVPIKGDCQIPTVDITPAEKVQFADACLNYPETKTIVLKNHSNIKAKFNVVPQSEESKVLAKYTVSPQSGFIEERETKTLEITLVTCKLGEITLPLHINIVGTNNNQPNLLNICANSDGPKVQVFPEELDFGQVDVLKDYFLKVTIVNCSKIKAQFHAFTRQKVSSFKPKVKHAFLEPGQRMQFDVICNADDASKFSDILHFVIKDGKDKDVVLKAKGSGSTIYCDDNLELLDFGTIYTYRSAVKEIFIQNRGRKSQKLSWQRKKAVEKKKKTAPSTGTLVVEEKVQEEQVFTIFPDTETIPPKYGRYYRFVAMSQKKGKISEQFTLMSQVGNERKATQLKVMTIEGDFTQPNIIYSQKKLNFKYLWQKNQPSQQILKQLQLTSGSPLPLNFNLKVAQPFSVSQENHSLNPGASTRIKVFFDPNFKVDKISGVLNGKINVVFADHPYRETVDLLGELCFPNLKMEASIVNFGAILNDTTKKIVMLIKNVSEMQVTYEWAFLEDEPMAPPDEDRMNLSSNSIGHGSIPINQVFDILPLSGRLEPNQVEEVEFIYNAQSGIPYRTTALCHVEGGPNYQVKLEGDSSLISGRISEKELDYGAVRFCEWVSKEIYIENTGKVTFEYKVDTQFIKRKPFVEITPMSGKIAGGTKFKVNIRVCPTMPADFEECFEIQMGYYDPQTIRLRGKGVYPSLVCALFPRLEATEFEARLKQQTDRYTKEYERKLIKQKGKKKDVKTPEQFRQELEKEMDRELYCRMIQSEISTYVKPQKQAIPNIETKLYDNLHLVTWSCDFDNVIIGSTHKRVLKFKNVGDCPIEMMFDTKAIKISDYKISPEKCKLAVDEEIGVTVTLSTKKNSKPGKLKASIVLEVKNGAKYRVNLTSNLTIPEIVVDGCTEGVLDFGRVQCGIKKTVTLRFLNLKEVPCDWSLNTKGETAISQFDLVPAAGRIPSGGFVLVKASFLPVTESQFSHKFPIKITENPKLLVIEMKGLGKAVNLDFQPSKIRIGPVLPYDDKAYAALEVYNTTKYMTELVSLDFDKRFKEEFEMMAQYEQIKNVGIAPQKPRVVFLPYREPGSSLWPEMIADIRKNERLQAIKKQMEGAPEDKKKALDAQLQELTAGKTQIAYPKKVITEHMRHFVITGPSKVGKTHVAETISKLYSRCVLRLDEIYHWHQSNKSEYFTSKIAHYLNERKKQMETALLERQKALKKAGKKAKELEDKLGPTNPDFYQILPESCWVEMIKARIKHPDCGAGVVFDGLSSKNLVGGQLAAISVIMKAVGPETLTIVQMNGIVLPAPKKEDDQRFSNTGMTLSQITPVPNTSEEPQITFQIKDTEDEATKKVYKEYQQQLTKLVANETEVNCYGKLYHDPVFAQVGMKIDISPLETPVDGEAHQGSRDTTTMPIFTSNIEQKNWIANNIPAPVYPDPMKELLPEAYLEEMIAKPTGKPYETKLLKQFAIFTPKDHIVAGFNLLAQPSAQKTKLKSKSVASNASQIAGDNHDLLQQLNLKQMSKQPTRWLIPPESTLRLVVKFTSKKPGAFESVLAFENTFCIKKALINITGRTQFPIVVNVPKTLFNTVKKSRPTTVPECYMNRVFVIGENVFDFGGLLAGKNPEKKTEKEMVAMNSTVFKIVNGGPYPAEVEYAFLSTIMEGDSAFKKGVFVLSSDKMTIPIESAVTVPAITAAGQSALPAAEQGPTHIQELRVWAVPDEAKLFKDELIVMIKDNPNPIVIPLRCLGSKPEIKVLEGAPMKFNRILLNQLIKRELKIQNPSAIPVKFRLEGCEKLPQEFSVQIKEGKLKPSETIVIEVTFRAIKQQKFAQTLKLIAQDTQGLGKLSEYKDIPIEAEAFDINLELKFPSENTENLLDFGAVRVGDFVDRNFTVKNTGLYNVKLSFTMKKKSYKQTFRIEPMQIQLEPNNSKEILVRFSSLKELKLKTNSNTTDIIMEVLEGKTLQTHRSVPINVNVNAVFSNYSIVPLKNINFGPIQFNQSKTRTFEIKNQGLFEFAFSIFDYLNEEFRKEMLANLQKEKQNKLQAASTLAPSPPTDKKAQAKEVKKAAPAGKGAKNPKDENSLKIGQWTITPASGLVAPESSALIEVTFAGSGQKLYEQKIGVDIENRNPTDEPNGILYEMVAESCIPGINTDNYEAIFEEQLVMPSQQHATSVVSLVKSNVYFVEEKVFSFGTLVPSKNPQGIAEKIKIENSNKVPCTVKFEVKKKSPNALEQFAFDVEPKEVKIPPHESHYVKIIFNPLIMASYAGLFTALVDNGDQQPKTHKLIFDLKGQGALPTIKVEKPKDFHDERTLLLKFPRTRIGKVSTQSISLKNDGSIPATAKFDLIASDCFRFLDSPSFSLTPKSYAAFAIEYRPSEPGNKVWEISAQTLLNQFETMKFRIEGQAYLEDILFQNLPNDEEDKINMEDCAVKEEKRISFMIRNNAKSVLKFIWPVHDDFCFTPRIGHIASGSAKAVTLTFCSDKTVTYKDLPLLCESVQVRQNAPQFIDWDDSMKIRKFVSQSQMEWINRKNEEEKKRREEEAETAKKAAGKKDTKKAPKVQEKKDREKCPDPLPGEQADIAIQQVLPEAESTTVEKSQKVLTLKASAVADYSRYQIQENMVDFHPTMMYTTRVHRVTFKNVGLTKLVYTCKIVSAKTGKIDPGFFAVVPHSGTVNPSCDENLTIKFSPVEIEDTIERLLIISIKNIDPTAQKLILELNGEIERPVCHFELAPSKYREKKPDLEEKYKVIEFDSLGTKVKNTRKFYVINPTALGYDFEWKRVDDDKASNSGFFRCSTSKGTILSGKKAEMIFEYTPDFVGTHDSYWTFQIPSEKIIQNFYVVGSVIEPNVFFDVGKINFGPLLLGGKNKEVVHLKNLQEVPLSFNFDKDSIKGELDSAGSLTVEPISGVIPPQSDTKVEFTFEPRTEQSFNYNVACNIKRRSRPICINIKGIGYVLSHSVFLSTRMNNVIAKGEKVEVNFGNIVVNQTKSHKLFIENNGDFNFDFALVSAHQYHPLKISHEFGTVRKNERFTIELEFHPEEQFAFKSNAQLTLSIISGPTYIFTLRGSAKHPGIDFSFFNYDFGPCFVLKQPLPITTFLQVRNRENYAMSIESLFKKTDHLEVKIPSGQVALPLEVITTKSRKGGVEKEEKNLLRIPIVFTPRQFSKYQEQLVFEINGLNKIQVKVKGQGIPLKLEIEKTQDQNIDFGVTRVNSESHRTVALVNNSKKPVEITLDVESQLEELKKMFVSVSPTTAVTIQPRDKQEFEIIFKPLQRINPFKAQLLYKIVENQEKKKFLNVFTTAHGIEMKLMEDTVGFGTVVVKSKISKTVQLSNFGDIGSKFQWDTIFCGKYFSISPAKGYLPPHEDLMFEITFHPNVPDNDIRFRVKCGIEGIEPLWINLVGKCIPQPAETIQKLRFDCQVRKQVIQKINMKNPTAKPWKIKASIASEGKHNYFHGKEFLEVPAGGQASYDVVYRPLTMTKNNQIAKITEQSHLATLFFPIPDGTAQMFQLVGTAAPPTPLETYDLNCKAKSNLVHMIPIQNWLKVAQRFNVDWTFDVEDKSIFMNAANIFDLAADSTKEYKLAIYSIKACAAKFTLFLRNPNTFEFLSYRINLTVTPADPMKQIVLSSLVRETTSKLVTIENPFPQLVEIKKEMIIVDSEVVFVVPPNGFSIPAKSEFGVQILFRPLQAKQENSKIQIKSPKLGDFLFPLKLVGSPSTAQRSMAFKTSLGSELTQKFKFTHFGKKPSVYNCRVDKLGQKTPVNVDPKQKAPAGPVLDFSTETPTVNAPASDSFEGVEVTVNIRFEPSSMGETSCVLILSSPDSGEYSCILNGYTTQPQPKGPFKIAGAKPPPIDFKNPFFEATQFVVRIDNPSFTSSVKSPVKVDGKKVLSMAVAYKQVAGTSANGRMTLSVGDNLSWVFYLQGE